MKAGKSVDEATASFTDRQVSRLQEGTREGFHPGRVRRAQEVNYADEGYRCSRRRCGRRALASPVARSRRRAAGARLPSSAPELDEPGHGRRLVREGVSEHVEDDLGRDDRRSSRRTTSSCCSRRSISRRRRSRRPPFWHFGWHVTNERADDGAAARRRRHAAAALHRARKAAPSTSTATRIPAPAASSA